MVFLWFNAWWPLNARGLGAVPSGPVKLSRPSTLIYWNIGNRLRKYILPFFFNPYKIFYVWSLCYNLPISAFKPSRWIGEFFQPGTQMTNCSTLRHRPVSTWLHLWLYRTRHLRQYITGKLQLRRLRTRLHGMFLWLRYVYSPTVRYILSWPAHKSQLIHNSANNSSFTCFVYIYRYAHVVL